MLIHSLSGPDGPRSDRGMDMPAKKYIVELDAGERELLTGFISTLERTENRVP